MIVAMPARLPAGAGPRPRRVRRTALAITAALAAALVALPWVYQARYAGRILPGVRAAGVDLGGLTGDEALAHLREALPITGGTVRLRDPEDGRTWDVPAADLGLDLAPEAWVARALEAGRTGDGTLDRWIEALRIRRTGLDVAADGIALDGDRARQTLEALRDDINVDPRPATITRADGRALAEPSTVGRALDIDATLAALAELARRPVTDTLALSLGGTAARVFDVSNVAEAYNLIVSAPITMTWAEGQAYAIPVATLKDWFRLEDAPNPAGDLVPSIVVDQAAIRQHVAPWAADIDHPGRDARYAVDASTGRFVLRDRGEPAIALDVDRTVEAVIRAAYTEQRVGAIAVDATGSPAHAALAGEINATVEEVARATTSVTGAPPGWVANLLVAADRLDGTVVAPGQAFSFNRALGTVAAVTGFDMAFAVDPLDPGGPVGAGGSITQVATTVFRAAMWAGLPLLERHPPAVRVGWVEPPIGLDAAVAPPARDLRVLNDTNGYVVIAAALDLEHGLLTATVYGKPREQRVTLDDIDVRAVAPPADPVTRRDARVPAGRAEQVTWAREGADVALTRRVVRGGQVVLEDRLTSPYRPAGDVTLVGTGAAAP